MSLLFCDSELFFNAYFFIENQSQHFQVHHPNLLFSLFAPDHYVFKNVYFSNSVSNKLITKLTINQIYQIKSTNRNKNFPCYIKEKHYRCVGQSLLIV